LPLAGPCEADDASPIRAYYYFVHWMSVGHPNLALEQFADDAVVVAGPACTPSEPCIGKAAIREGYFGALNTGRVALPLRDQRFDGRQLRTHGETIVQDELYGGIVRLRGGYVFEFRDGRIASLHVELDTSDKVTAAFVARQAAVAAIARR
jgi:hypothetical protein